MFVTSVLVLSLIFVTGCLKRGNDTVFQQKRGQIEGQKNDFKKGEKGIGERFGQTQAGDEETKKDDEVGEKSDNGVEVAGIESLVNELTDLSQSSKNLDENTEL